jgi:hypothetical protein
LLSCGCVNVGALNVGAGGVSVSVLRKTETVELKAWFVVDGVMQAPIELLRT